MIPSYLFALAQFLCYSQLWLLSSLFLSQFSYLYLSNFLAPQAHLDSLSFFAIFQAALRIQVVFHSIQYPSRLLRGVQLRLILLETGVFVQFWFLGSHLQPIQLRLLAFKSKTSLEKATNKTSFDYTFSQLCWSTTWLLLFSSLVAIISSPVSHLFPNIFWTLFPLSPYLACFSSCHLLLTWRHRHQSSFKSLRTESHRLQGTESGDCEATPLAAAIFPSRSSSITTAQMDERHSHH